MKRVILIADDSQAIRKFLTTSLTINGFDIVAATDGLDALEKMSSSKIDLVITDLNMPNIDGFELIRSIRKNHDYDELPIIILSSLSNMEDIKMGMSVGANSYLVKPFDQKRIQYEVSKYLN